MITLKSQRAVALSTRWELVALAFGGTVGILGAYLALTR